MEIIIIAGVIIAAAIYFIMSKRKDVPETVVKTEQAAPEPVVVKEEAKPVEVINEVSKALDVNGDGKVNLADATAVVKKATTKAKATVSKAKKKK